MFKFLVIIIIVALSTSCASVPIDQVCVNNNSKIIEQYTNKCALDLNTSDFRPSPDMLLMRIELCQAKAEIKYCKIETINETK